MPTDRDRGVAALRALGVAALACFFLVALAAVAVLTFSVRVSGTSMTPTLVPRDRLQTQFWDRSDVARFDLVETRTPDDVSIVKRVIGVPGDAISVEAEGGVPAVTVRPAGSSDRYRLENPAWRDQPGGNACCAADGTEGAPAEFVVPAGSYWLIGDNWGASDDSRTFGFFAADDIDAKLNFRILPVSRLGRVENPASLVPVD